MLWPPLVKCGYGYRCSRLLERLGLEFLVNATHRKYLQMHLITVQENTECIWHKMYKKMTWAKPTPQNLIVWVWYKHRYIMGALITIHGKLLPDEAAKTPLLSAVSNSKAYSKAWLPKLRGKKLIHNLFTILCSICSHLLDSPIFPDHLTAKTFWTKMHQ